MKRSFKNVSELKARLGEEIGVSDWQRVTQTQVQAFADATGDKQWIHLDHARAREESPFGGTVAHGFLTLSLAPALVMDMLELKGSKLAVNYGLNRVRFPAPVPVGSSVRARVVLKDVKDVSGGVQLALELSFECDKQDKPVCVAEWLLLFLL